MPTAQLVATGGRILNGAFSRSECNLNMFACLYPFVSHIHPNSALKYRACPPGLCYDSSRIYDGWVTDPDLQKLACLIFSLGNHSSYGSTKVACTTSPFRVKGVISPDVRR